MCVARLQEKFLNTDVSERFDSHCTVDMVRRLEILQFARSALRKFGHVNIELPVSENCWEIRKNAHSRDLWRKNTHIEEQANPCDLGGYQ